MAKKALLKKPPEKKLTEVDALMAIAAALNRCADALEDAFLDNDEVEPEPKEDEPQGQAEGAEE